MGIELENNGLDAIYREMKAIIYHEVENTTGPNLTSHHIMRLAAAIMELSERMDRMTRNVKE